MGTHPIFESDFDCLTEQILKMSKSVHVSQTVDNSKRIMGFLPEICTMQSDSWSEQTYTIKAKFQVTTITGLDQLNYKDSCECDTIETHNQGGNPCPCEIVFMVDGSESMEDSDFMREALVFIKKFVGSVDRDVLKKRNQQPITFTIVQFSGCSQLTKYYEPGHGFYNLAEFGNKTKLTVLERQAVFTQTQFANRLGKAGPGSFHWKSYSTLSSRTIIDEIEDGKESSFHKTVRKEFEDQKMLNGNSQLFLCLQDLSATADIKDSIEEGFTTTFMTQLDEKMKKYTDDKTNRVLIMLTDDKAFDDSEVQDLQLYNCKLENPNASQKKKYILEMAQRTYGHIYPIVLKTGKAKSATEIDMLHASANLTVSLSVDATSPIDHQMANIKRAIMGQLGLI